MMRGLGKVERDGSPETTQGQAPTEPNERGRLATMAGFGALASSPALDPNIHRDYNYQYTAGVQQEIYKGVTLNANWYRRSNYQGTPTPYRGGCSFTAGRPDSFAYDWNREENVLTFTYKSAAASAQSKVPGWHCDA